MGGSSRRRCAALSLVCSLSATALPAAEPIPAVKSAHAEDHAARGKLLEELGKTAGAAREYEAAFAETREPELLYRLAICWRTLGDYKQAREALRGYLREAPDGPLANEVERQLAQIAVLIEARGLQAQPPSGARDKPGKPHPERPRAIAQPQSTEPLSAIAPVHSPAAAPLIHAPIATPSVAPNATPSVALNLAPIVAGPPPEPTAAIQTPAVALPSTPGSSGFVSDQHEVAQAPAPALAAQASPEPSASHRYRSTAPWVAGGALLVGAAGTALCVGAHVISNDLDAKFAAGTLTPGDQPRYAKSRNEAIAGTALIAIAALALGTAAVLAW
jgi:hypothetical protein